MEMPKTGINAIVVSVSDTRNNADDVSGDLLVRLFAENGIDVLEKLIVPDELAGLRDTLFMLAGRDDVDLIITTGGTGFGPRDNTPEATRAVIEREAPGIAEAMRRESARFTELAMLSRGICGIRGESLIVNLPGSPKAVQQCFEVIAPVLPHAVSLIRGKTAH